MKLLLLLSTLAMPLIAWFTELGWFGPDSSAVANQYPTLLGAAGYAFAIWAMIFTMDVGFGVWYGLRHRPALPEHRELGIATALGFALTATWMIVFSQQWFWLALVIIWAALGSLLYACLLMARAADPRGHLWLGLLALGLHAGWLSLAAFLNTAQVIVAYGLLSTAQMLPWSLALWGIAAALLLFVNVKLHGHPAYAFAALWGLIAVYVDQSHSSLHGALASGEVALSLGAVVLAQTVILQWRAYQREERELLTTSSTFSPDYPQALTWPRAR